jgi:hypothetical protein
LDPTEQPRGDSDLQVVHHGRVQVPAAYLRISGAEGAECLCIGLGVTGLVVGLPHYDSTPDTE